ncbi:MAM domain and Concanavalin A-like lectin/glucanases superfamily domain-containing protein [Strongyloides ratti]|uniref:MAM domain and Concanavalin A-like lectin/glucanases superfamily domain-containing protein n=1 Tax=Strongyloides ratti TaxID=34506 RepID=A0A090KXI2_STRRB|nr:MAM domain and Concanavalin A-like lectin/glucanases superfamily domain-containing protein [Strongyloides ratti]CEF59973.1 MAM domain and Concanavalin A-like lectin/glucanases superfamily domain-containing protein [Strongyloides ratti]
MFYQEPIIDNEYNYNKHKFGGVKTILKSKNYLESENFITHDSDLSCSIMEECKWSNDQDDALDWIIIDNENGYVKNLLPKKFLQNSNEYFLVSTSERPSYDSAHLISDPINCQNTYGYLSFKCFISQPKDIGNPPILEICTKVIKQKDLTNCQRVHTNPNYYVHKKIPEMDLPFSIVIRASNFNNPVEGGLVVIHDIKYEIGKEGVINSCELINSLDINNNDLSLLNNIPSVTINYETLNQEDNLNNENFVKEIEPNNRIYPLPKNEKNDVIESVEYENENEQLKLSTKKIDIIKSEENLIVNDKNNILPLPKMIDNNNNNNINVQNSNYDESKMSCDVIKCSPERLSRETNCLYNNFIITSDGEESLGSGWEVVLVNDYPSSQLMNEKYSRKNILIDNLFLTANFYGNDTPTYIFESPNVNFDDSKELYLSFQRHISITGVELVICGNKNGSNCFWSSEGDEIKDEWIIEHVPLIPELSNIVFIAKPNYNVSPQTIGQVGLFDIKLYIKKNDSLILYC